MKPTASDSLVVNGRSYAVPTTPAVVITIDGGDPSYFADAFSRGIMPNLEQMTKSGCYGMGSSEVPSLTNPNNMSIVTGVPPAIHGIPGNFHLTDDGQFELLNDPAYLRCESIHAAFVSEGYKVAAVTTKDKLRQLLAKGNVPTASVEKASELGIPEFAIENVEGWMGETAPGVYEPFASHYCMRMGLKMLKENPDLKLLYVTLTDRVQHASAPGGEMSDAFLIEFDRILGQYLELDIRLGITADHGMNSKHDEESPARIVYIKEVLQDAGVEFQEVVLPITDPYPKHHGALGSFAWIYLPESQRELARQTLHATAGVEEVWFKEEAAIAFSQPVDRIGDIAVTGASDTALGTRAEDHDLSQLHGPLRSHGGRHEQTIPLMVNFPLTGFRAQSHAQGILRNRDIHDLVLNGK
ncbi:alkaline phosphatase family protein [Corynebacterium appendicis]|uniref:alkaline phosphatase family protein n=1 Tax=Corynebacterium appendicis TaxID=163202 RepID=UPI00223AEA80|nr:alkaline phosphatase family protein [Corynebacterium appendicis]MCT1684702.1 alkaline phosphatase family protein [Corynebacterium appendicis]